MTMYPLQCQCQSFLAFLCLFFSFSLLFFGGLGEGNLSSSSRNMAADHDDQHSKPLKIVFDGPAINWTDALPIGNGHFGAMVRGGVPSEILNLNEDTLWTGIPGNYTDPNVPKALKNVRQLVDSGKFSQATALADTELSGAASEAYQLVGDIKLVFDDAHTNYTKLSYHRELDLDTATVKVRYSVGDVDYTREYFASNPDKVIVTKLSSSKQGSLSFTVSLDSQMTHRSFTNDKYQIIMEGSCRGTRRKPSKGASVPKGIQYSSVLNLQIGGSNGTIDISDGKLSVQNADVAIILVVASSSFDGPFVKPNDSKKNPTSEALKVINSIKKLSYPDLYARHLDDYQRLFHRVSLRLSKSIKTNSSTQPGDMVSVTTAERVRSFAVDEDPSLVELLFQYGRYLLISSSRPGSQPANLQGIWNKDVDPPWDGAPHLNINLQMNYWHSLSTNLQECQEPLLDFVSSLAINGNQTAKVNYGAEGWVAHQVTDIWAKTSPDRGQAVWAMWPMGGAWVSTHLWEHYTHTMDKTFLEKQAYPLLQGAAAFLLDWWIVGKDGILETNPSTSPEHMFTSPDDGKPASVSYSSTMDIAITKDVFSIIVSAAEVLGRTGDDLVQRVVKAQTKLPPYKIARDGSLMEWAEDFKDPDPNHRHVSHLYGIYPGHSITPEKNPDLCQAANHSLHKRGEEGPGWSTVWKASLWAHLQNSEHAYRMVKHLFNLVDPDREADFEGGLYSNLFSAHPPFQIDANFGFSAAIAEMLVQSTVKDLFLLPALPKDKWPTGCVKGLKARGGVTVNICWTEGELHEVTLWSTNSNIVKTLHYRGAIVTASISSRRVYTYDRLLKCVNTYSLY